MLESETENSNSLTRSFPLLNLPIDIQLIVLDWIFEQCYQIISPKQDSSSSLVIEDPHTDYANFKFWVGRNFSVFELFREYEERPGRWMNKIIAREPELTDLVRSLSLNLAPELSLPNPGLIEYQKKTQKPVWRRPIRKNLFYGQILDTDLSPEGSKWSIFDLYQSIFILGRIAHDEIGPNPSHSYQSHVYDLLNTKGAVIPPSLLTENYMVHFYVQKKSNR